MSVMGPYCKVYGRKKVGVHGVLSCGKNVEDAGQPIILGQVYWLPISASMKAIVQTGH